MIIVIAYIIIVILYIYIWLDETTTTKRRDNNKKRRDRTDVRVKKTQKMCTHNICNPDCAHVYTIT